MWRVYMLLVAVTVIAGITPIAVGGATHELPPLSIPVVRFGVAGTLLWLTARGLGLNKPVPRDCWPKLVILGALCVPINQFGYLYGIKIAGATHGAVAYALVPVLVFWISVCLGRAPVTFHLLIASALACTGAVAIVVSRNDIVVHSTGRALTGDMLLLLAAVSWSFFVVLSQPMVITLGAVRALSLVMLIGTALHVPLIFVDAAWFELGDFTLSSVTWRGVAGLLYITLITAYLNYLLWYIVTSRYDITKAAIFTNAHFIITVVADAMIVGAVLSWWTGVGSLILFSGVALASTARDRGVSEAS